MPSQISVQRQIGQALAESLSAYTFSGAIDTIEAVYRRRPDYGVEDLGTLKVSVVPGPFQSSAPSTFNAGPTRGSDYVTVTYGVVIAKHVGDDSEMEQLEDLAQEIMDVVRSDLLSLSDVPDGVQWSEFGQPMAFDPDALGDRSVWMSQVELTFTVPLARLSPPAE